MTSPVSAVEAVEKAMEGDRHRSLVEMIAWAMASRSVGDPQAIDMNGMPRWTWYVDEVERFVKTHRYELRLLLSCSPDRMREVLSLARKAEALQRENADLREALEPFAAIADQLPIRSVGVPDHKPLWGYDGAELSYGDFRRARAHLGGSDAGN